MCTSFFVCSGGESVTCGRVLRKKEEDERKSEIAHRAKGSL